MTVVPASPLAQPFSVIRYKEYDGLARQIVIVEECEDTAYLSVRVGNLAVVEIDEMRNVFIVEN